MNTYTNPKLKGRIAQLEEVYERLVLEQKAAYETFMLFRRTDSHYADERTDYTLSKYNAYDFILNAIGEELRQLNERLERESARVSA